MLEGLSIRFATQEDKEQILNIVKNTWDWGDYIPTVLDDWLKHGKVFVAELSGRIIAMSHFVELEEGLGWVEGARVAKEYRGMGVATRVLERIKEYASSIGIKRLRLVIAVDNTPSIKHVKKCGFYEKLSFSQYEAQTGYYREFDVQRIEVDEFVEKCKKGAYRGMYFWDFRWSDITKEKANRFIQTGSLVKVSGTTVLVATNQKTEAVIGYLEPSSTFPDDVLSYLHMRLFAKARFVVPSNMILPLTKLDTEFTVYECAL